MPEKLLSLRELCKQAGLKPIPFVPVEEFRKPRGVQHKVNPRDEKLEAHAKEMREKYGDRRD